jgi:ribose/xylose/arabinose/galactoside ABC-type transport system permease subunit
MRFIKTFILLLFLIVTALFFLQNSVALEQEVDFQFKLYLSDYIWDSGPLPFFFVILFAFAVGALLSIFLLGMERFRLGNRIRAANKKIRILEKELQGLLELPLSAKLEQDIAQPPASA